jgi:hypothetical protein
VRQPFYDVAVPGDGAWHSLRDIVGRVLPPFTWVHIENRSAAVLNVSLRSHSGNVLDGVWRVIAANGELTANCHDDAHDDAPADLWFNANAAATLLVEVSDRVIVNFNS